LSAKEIDPSKMSFCATLNKNKFDILYNNRPMFIEVKVGEQVSIPLPTRTYELTFQPPVNGTLRNFRVLELA